MPTIEEILIDSVKMQIESLNRVRETIAARMNLFVDSFRDEAKGRRREPGPVGDAK